MTTVITDKVQLGSKFPTATAITATRPKSYWKLKTFNIEERSCQLKSRPNRLFTTGKCLEDTFQLVHYLVCISLLPEVNCELWKALTDWSLNLQRNLSRYMYCLVPNSWRGGKVHFQHPFQVAMFAFYKGLV